MLNYLITRPTQVVNGRYTRLLVKFDEPNSGQIYRDDCFYLAVDALRLQSNTRTHCAYEMHERLSPCLHIFKDMTSLIFYPWILNRNRLSNYPLLHHHSQCGDLETIASNSRPTFITRINPPPPPYSNRLCYRVSCLFTCISATMRITLWPYYG